MFSIIFVLFWHTYTIKNSYQQNFIEYENIHAKAVPFSPSWFIPSTSNPLDYMILNMYYLVN